MLVEMCAAREMMVTGSRRKVYRIADPVTIGIGRLVSLLLMMLQLDVLLLLLLLMLMLMLMMMGILGVPVPNARRASVERKGWLIVGMRRPVDFLPAVSGDVQGTDIAVR